MTARRAEEREPVDLEPAPSGTVPDAHADLDALVEPLPTGRSWVWRLPYEAPPLTANKVANPMGAAALRRKHAAVIGNALLRVVHPTGWDLVDIELVWFRPRSGRADPDNICPTLKPVQDALVESGVIPDDKSRHVHRVSARIVDRRNDPHPERGGRVLLVVRELERPEGSA